MAWPNAGESAGHWLGPWNGTPLPDQRVVGGQVVPDPIALLEVVLLLLVGMQVLHPQVEPAPVAGGLLPYTSALRSRGRAKNRPASAKVSSISPWSIP